ncbi:MAG: magnesium transporter [Firmicutes bacterium]|nr:magnesium transporter [Bacillota bacterium]
MKNELLDMVENNFSNKQLIKKKLADMNIVDIAEIFDDLEKEKALQIFRLLPKNKAADVFSYISPEKQKLIIEAITDKELGKIIDDLYLDDTVDLLEEMPANVVRKILKNTDRATRKIINQFLNYPEDSAGSVMTIEYVDLQKDMTIREAIDTIRKTVEDKETFEICYVVSEERLLEGTVSIKDILLTNDDKKISDIMDNKNIIYVNTTDDKEFVSKLFMKYDCSSLAVVDNEKRLVGIITVDDVVDIIQDENTEDFELMAAMTPSEKPYLKTSILKLAINRIPWLLFLMISATLTGFVINNFETELAKESVLIAFIPMLMDTGGNSGSQAATLAIRGLALNEIKTSDFFAVMFKESSVGLIAGFVLAVFNFFRLLILKYDILVALTVCSSILLTVVISNIIGGILPLIAKFLKLDPALMAAPLITTIVDVISLIAYFCIASSLLNI